MCLCPNFLPKKRKFRTWVKGIGNFVAFQESYFYDRIQIRLREIQIMVITVISFTYCLSFSFHSLKMHAFPLHLNRVNYRSKRRGLRKEKGRISNKPIPCIAKKNYVGRDKHGLQGIRWSKRHINHDLICELTWILSTYLIRNNKIINEWHRSFLF